MTSYKLIFSAQAQQDLKEAKTWYNLQQKDLGKKLIDDVKDVLGSIRINPFYASVKYANIRTAACKTFPYAIHYEIDEHESLVRIVSIFHFSRRAYWL
jgi:toxin ParE1/3/4